MLKNLLKSSFLGSVWIKRDILYDLVDKQYHFLKSSVLLINYNQIRINNRPLYSLKNNLDDLGVSLDEWRSRWWTWRKKQKKNATILDSSNSKSRSGSLMYLTLNPTLHASTPNAHARYDFP